MIIVGIASVLDPFAQGIPVGKIVAIFYIITEALSVLENAAILGVPLPAMLVDTLLKVRDSKQPTVLPGSAPLVETHVHTNKPVVVNEAPANDPARKTQHVVIQRDPPSVG